MKGWDLDTARGTVLDPQQKRQWAMLSVVSVTVDRGKDLKPALGPAQVPKPANPRPHPELLSSLLRADTLPVVPRGLQPALPSLQKPRILSESGGGLLDKGKRDGRHLHPAPSSWDLPGLVGEGFPPSGCTGPQGACSESSLFQRPM